MPRGHRDRIADILAAIADIQAGTEGMNLAAFENNPVVVRSVLFLCTSISVPIPGVSGV
ncbi:hypothetical protein MTBLM5_110079 [Magnetospirillum sp. LM-5]|uniref:hypothetical protein n=1 Tax=Magnetospirillum sp. LM-5 TaxID=2681466 RepID=UPI00137DDE2B|nr:hypothetical protein [Magnetospirillum sp. LM-5]CAA7613325.1 hypothetical protein MTBLM5_110079 [Magnetospirillum sp. LM-5]